VAFDAFLKLDGIDGDSVDRQYERWIEVLSFSWGASNTSQGQATGGAGSGKVSFQDFHFMMNFNKASPELLKRCASGEHIKTGVLSVRKAGEKPLEFYKVRMTDILVSSYQDSGSSELPMDSVSLNFSNVAIDFTQQSPTG
jgi:type VI secretion system secreted protein Hcp